MPRPWITAALLYAIITLFLLYPAWTDPLHGVVGDWTHPDMISNHWLYRWLADQVHSGGSILHNDRYYAPIGDGPWLAGNGSDALPFALSAGWLPWPASVTLWTFLTVVLNGMGGYTLARAAGAGAGGAMVAGATLVWCPYVSRELSAGRFAQASLWACGFFLASWLRLLDAPTLRRGVAAGLLFGLCAFTYWYDGLWMAMAGAILWLARPRLRALAAFVPTALLATVPPLAAFLSHWTEIPGTAEATFPHPIAITYALPPAFPMWSGTGALATLVLPATCLALAIAGWSRTPRPLRWGTAAAAVLFYTLCLGPRILAPDGSATEIPGPFVLLYGWTATLQRFWWPYRHLAPLTLCLVPLVAAGAERAIAWVGGAWAPLVVIAVLPLELAARSAATSVESSWFSPPEGYQTLATLPAGAVLELPIASTITRTQASLSYQWVDGHTRVNGHAMWVDRVRPKAWDTWVGAQPLLAALRDFEEGKQAGAWTLPDHMSPVPEGVRYISLNREFFPGELVKLMRLHATFLTDWFGPPVVKAGGVRVWDLTHYQAQGTYDFPKWKTPTGYVSADGLSALPETVGSAGWRHWPRAFPPSEPAAGPTTDTTTKEVDAVRAELPLMVRRKLERASHVADTGAASESPSSGADSAPGDTDP